MDKAQGWLAPSLKASIRCSGLTATRLAGLRQCNILEGKSRLAVYLKGRESRTYVLQTRVTNAVRIHAGRLSGLNAPHRTSNSPPCS